jgi:uncharacterized membrane protein SpoIIM required for sporulation
MVCGYETVEEIGYNMTEGQFVLLNKARWDEFQALLKKKKNARFSLSGEAWKFPRAYRKMCRDLNQAKSERYSLGLVDTLNRQVWEGHQILYRSRTEPLIGMIRRAFMEFPGQLRRFGKAFALCHILFYGLVGLTFLFGLANPGQIESFLGTDLMGDLDSMYDPESPDTLRPKGVESDADMFGFYISNNISIGFRTFAGGVLVGLGSLFFLVYNALFMGAVMSFINSSGYDLNFYQFVLGHGAFELTAVIIFALAGFELGSVIIKPGRESRTVALRKQGKAVLPLVIGATIFLFIAACLEAFWSARNLASYIKFIVAAVLWVIVYSYIIFGARHERTVE